MAFADQGYTTKTPPYINLGDVYDGMEITVSAWVDGSIDVYGGWWLGHGEIATEQNVEFTLEIYESE